MVICHPLKDARLQSDLGDLEKSCWKWVSRFVWTWVQVHQVNSQGYPRDNAVVYGTNRQPSNMGTVCSPQPQGGSCQSTSTPAWRGHISLSFQSCRPAAMWSPRTAVSLQFPMTSAAEHLPTYVSSVLRCLFTPLAISDLGICFLIVEL